MPVKHVRSELRSDAGDLRVEIDALRKKLGYPPVVSPDDIGNDIRYADAALARLLASGDFESALAELIPSEATPRPKGAKATGSRPVRRPSVGAKKK